MRLKMLLRSGLGSRLIGAVLFAAIGASLERLGWKTSAILWVVVIGSLGLGLLRRAYAFEPPIAKHRAMGAGA